MACSEQIEITSAQDDDCPQTESTPYALVKSSTVRRSGLLGRLQESVLIKSKAANMILLWSTMAHFIYGMALNPNFIFIVLQSGFLSGAVPFISAIGSGLYGLIAAWLLFYPLAGYLADVRYGRYKVVIFSLRMIWFALVFLVVAGAILSIVTWPVYFAVPSVVSNPTGILISYVVLMGVAGFLTLLLLFIGFAAFAANVVQFGTDQLRDLPARDSFLFIHWLLFTQYIGVSIGMFVWSISFITLFTSLGTFALGWLLLIFVMPISFCIAKSRWFVTDTGLGNPYREVARVVGFARRHKVPIQRSAFTYWEDDIPTGLDLGKSKYGGPFTTEQVENVKAFFGIVYILLALGPFFTADIAASAFLPVLKHHMDNWKPTPGQYWNTQTPYFMFANGGTLYPLFIVVLIPIYLKIIEPLFKRYIPNILKRVGIGLCLITVSLLCSLLVDTIGHALPSGQNATSVFNPNSQLIVFSKTNISGYRNSSIIMYTGFQIIGVLEAPSLQLSPHILIIQNFLVAVAYILIYGGVFEFICAQSPHSMKGVLIGILFAVKGLFQLIGVLGILLPFSFWQNSRRVGLTYFLVSIVISVVGVVAFTVAARRYQYRQRDEFCNIRKYIEDFYEKDVQHNHKFEELHVNFSLDSDPED